MQQLGPTRNRQAPWIRAAKLLLYLTLYYGGLFRLVRAMRRAAGASRACVLLYHRVNDLGDDPLTTPVRRFAEHMLVLRKFYTVLPSALLVDTLEAGQPLPNNAVAIHFDDGYRDVFTHAKPILGALNFPAAVFVSSGYVGTKRRFAHDGPFPWHFENLRPQDLREMAASGFEIGSHTVNHVDLAQSDDETVIAELMESKRDLEAIIGGSVTLFSFPFGKEANTRPEVEALVRKAGYRAMFSADGGYITSTSNRFHLCRVGGDGDTRPLELLMEIEGLSIGALRRRWQERRVSRVASRLSRAQRHPNRRSTHAPGMPPGDTASVVPAKIRPEESHCLVGPLRRDDSDGPTVVDDQAAGGRGAGTGVERSPLAGGGPASPTANREPRS